MLSLPQRNALVKFYDIWKDAAEISEHAKTLIYNEAIMLHSLVTGKEYSHTEDTVYFAGNDKEEQCDTFDRGLNDELSRRGFTTFDVKPYVSLVMDDTDIVGLISKKRTYLAHSIEFDTYTSSEVVAKVVRAYITEFKASSTAKPVKHLELQEFSHGIKSTPTTTTIDYKYDVLPSFYPYMSHSPEELWDRFKESSSNVMVLIGPPGTGKTTFIRRMLDRQGWNDVHIADDHSVLTNKFMPDAIRHINDGGVFVAEDADSVVRKRENGNALMSAILNTTEGILKKDVKLIISTNLPTVRDIDPALIRLGRAFGVFEFRGLTYDEVASLRNDIGLIMPDVDQAKKSWTLSEAINMDEEEQEYDRRSTVVGFV